MKNSQKRPLKHYVGLLYIMPWILGFLLLQFYPFVSSLVYSFTDYSMMKAPNWTGLGNYIRLFATDPEFKNSMKVTGLYALISVPAKLVFALLVAMILNTKIRGINFYRTVYYLPSILGGSVAVSALWKIMFMKNGIINSMIGTIGLGPVDWVGPGMALCTISLLQVWQFGSSMVLFLAALKNIPSELSEAAAVDGANRVHVFFKITLPMISPIIFFNLIMQSINALQNFTSAFVVTNGGPMQSTYVMGMKLYTDAFSYFQMGYASAQSWVLFAVILVLTALIFKSSDAWVYYEDGGEF